MTSFIFIIPNLSDSLNVLFIWLVFFFETVFPCSHNWPGTHYVNQSASILQRFASIFFSSAGTKGTHHYTFLYQ